MMMKQSPEEESSEEESGSEWEVEEILDERNTGDEKEYTKKRKSNLIWLIFLFEKVFDQVEGLARGSCDVADARGLQELDDGACRMGSQEKEQAGWGLLKRKRGFL